MLYVDVILPVPLHDVFTYLVPTEISKNIHQGSRVIVQFGKKKFYTALVYKVYNAPQKTEEIKEIIAILDDHPILNSFQMKFWDWMASYYMCSLGDVFRAALPSALKIESETFVMLNPDYEGDEVLTPNEKKIYDCFSTGRVLNLSEIEKQSGIANVVPSVKTLSDKKIILLKEKLGDDYSAKTEVAIQLAKEFDEGELNEILDSLKRAPKQQELLMSFLQLESKWIFRKDLLQLTGATTTLLNELVKKQILSTYKVEVDRIDYGDSNLDAAHELNIWQKESYDKICQSFADSDVALLHGVTGSGKTEIYIQLIKDIISQGKQVLYLVPEIALTTQLADRLQRVFGNKLAVFHSRFNENERAEVWNKLLLNDECQIVLGARSAIFLPFSKLGLVVVDEEHETSYKQQNPAPRYNARNASIVLAQLHKAKVLLGTATPSLETYYNALAKRYALINLDKRHSDIALPRVEVVNTKELRRKKQMKSFLSPPLIKHIEDALQADKQVILFQNRRGFAPLLECKTCSWTPLCSHCDVSLTYHKGANTAICHYCGATYKVPTECPNCETPTLDSVGYGTERVEEEVVAAFPEAKVVRMDLDTTRGKKSYEKIIADFAANRSDILVGTQMVSKGLDFDAVRVVGVLNADSLMNYPDFRAHERAFQMLTQVSGRAGRKGEQGTVVLQTSQPNHPIIQFVQQNNYRLFYDLQIEERKLFRYPPFFRLIEITFKARDYQKVEDVAVCFGNLLKKTFGERVLGPVKPPISRIQRMHIRKIILKVENNASIKDIRDNIYYCQQYAESFPDYKSVMISYDVDPM